MKGLPTKYQHLFLAMHSTLNYPTYIPGGEISNTMKISELLLKRELVHLDSAARFLGTRDHFFKDLIFEFIKLPHKDRYKDVHSTLRSLRDLEMSLHQCLSSMFVNEYVESF